MDRITVAATVVLLLAAGTACSGGSGSASKPTCQSLVGQPFTDAWDVKNNDLKCSDGVGFTSFSFGCYNSAGINSGKQVVTITTAKGKYFGVPGGLLMFSTDPDISLEQMNAKAGCV